MTETFDQGYALIVGVGADLPITISDANSMAELLCDKTRCAYPENHVQLLTGEHAYRKNILTALDEVRVQTASDPEATVIIYFSGHGAEIPGYYLIPYGFNPDALYDTAISAKEFTEKLNAITAKKLVVLLDCCHAGGMADVKGHVFAKSPSPPGFFDILKRGKGRVLIASSRKDEVSYAYNGDHYSVFTGALLEALAGYGAFEDDGRARILDTALWLGRKIPDRTKDQQHPIIKLSNLDDNFALAYYAGGAKRPKKLDWVRFTPPIKQLGGLEVETRKRMLMNYRRNLLLIEERMSEYVEFNEIPLQLVKNYRDISERIVELEVNIIHD